MDASPALTESGLRALFLRERPALLRLLVVRLGSLHEAEDALQDAWLKLESAAGPIANPTAYFFRMAHNAAVDRRRTALSQAVRDAHWLGTQASAIEHPDQETVLLARQRLRHIEAALAALPERVGQAFRMFRLENIPQKQIAQEMGLSRSAVEKLLQRAYREIHDAGRKENEDRVVPLRLDSEDRSR